MTEDDPALAFLQSAQFRVYCLNLLEAGLPPAETYQRILDFIRRSGVDEEACAKVEAAVAPDEDGQQAGTFNFRAFSEAVEAASCVLRAVKRLARSQHQDGGWGAQVEQSDLWHTSCALLALGEARRSEELVCDVPVSPCLSRGYAYLEHNADRWAADALEAEGAVPVHHLALAARCFFSGGREFLRRDTAVRLYRSLDHLARAQNQDGGWDACLWGDGVMAPRGVCSEVAATGAAMQALALAKADRFLPIVIKAAQWLLNTQNLDGSWNDGSVRPDLPPFTLTGDGRVTKTCDALAGLAALGSFDQSLKSYQGAMRRAAGWIEERMRPVFTRRGSPKGWAWGYRGEDYENAALVLETLLELPRLAPSLASSAAAWLMETQRRQEGDVEDGAWVLGPTARITAALAGYYPALRGPLLDNRWLP